MEFRKDGTERLVGFWRYPHTHWVGGGLVVLKRIEDQIVKVWEDNSSWAYIRGYGSSDLNKDGKLDFAVAGSGYTEQRSYRTFIAIYLSGPTEQYRRQIIPFDHTLHHLALGDIDGDQNFEIVFTEQIYSHPEGISYGWLELEVKIGRWENGNFQAKGTGIYLPVGAQWSHFTLGDVNNDGKDELLIYSFGEEEPIQSVLVFDLNGGTTPIQIIPRPDMSDPSALTISVNRAGQILEFKQGEIKPTVLNPGNGLFKIAPIEIPEIDFTQWKPVQVTSNLVLSEPINGNNNDWQITFLNTQ